MRGYQGPGARGGASTLYDPRRPVDIANVIAFPRGQTSQATINAITQSKDELMRYNRAFPNDGAKAQSLQLMLGNLAPVTSRGQGEPVTRWELFDSNEFFPSDRTPTYLSYTFFPAVLRLGNTIASIPYIVIYSSHTINPSFLAEWGLNGSPGDADFGVMRTVPSQYNTSERVNIYRRFIADESAKLSILAALTNTSPMSGSYVYILPWVTRQFFEAHIARMGPNGFNVGGPSMGLALAAAVLGCQPILYTGQLANFGDRGRLPSTEEQKAAAQNDAFGLYPSRNFTIVEDVRELGHKMALAVQMGVPIVLPFKSQLGGNIRGWMDNARLHDPGLRFLLESVGSIHTAADIEDGVNFRTRLSPVYMCVTLMDAAIGAANQWYAYFAMTNVAPTTTYLTQAPQEIETLEDANYRRLAPLKARAIQRARESAELRKTNPSQWVTQKREAAARKIGESAAKKMNKVREVQMKQAQKAMRITADKKEAQKNPFKLKLAAGRFTNLGGKAKRQSSTTVAERAQRTQNMLNAAVQRAIAQQQIPGGGANVGPGAPPQIMPPPPQGQNQLPDFDIDLDEAGGDVPNVFDEGDDYDYMDEEPEQVAGGGALATLPRSVRDARGIRRATASRQSARRAGPAPKTAARSAVAKPTLRMAAPVGRGRATGQIARAVAQTGRARPAPGIAPPPLAGSQAAGVFGAGNLLNQHWNTRRINTSAPAMAAGLGSALDMMF